MLVLDTDAASVIAKGELLDPLLKAYRLSRKPFL